MTEELPSQTTPPVPTQSLAPPITLSESIPPSNDPAPVEVSSSNDSPAKEVTVPSTRKAANGKPKKSPPPERVRGKTSLAKFRALLEKVINQPALFSDEEIRWAGEVLHAGAEDTEGTIRITWSPAPNTVAKRFKFSRILRNTGEVPGDDSIREISREIALIQDEEVAAQRIENLSKEFILRAAALYGFKSDTAIGLKSAFASVVHDIRQMENIAASGNKKKPETT